MENMAGHLNNSGEILQPFVNARDSLFFLPRWISYYQSAADKQYCQSLHREDTMKIIEKNKIWSTSIQYEKGSSFTEQKTIWLTHNSKGPNSKVVKFSTNCLTRDYNIRTGKFAFGQTRENWATVAVKAYLPLQVSKRIFLWRKVRKESSWMFFNQNFKIFEL